MHTTHAEMLPTLNDFLTAACAELRHSGSCAQSAVLFRENAPIVGVLTEFRGSEHKEAVWQTIIDTAHAFGADAVGLILDVYCAPLGSGLAPSEDPCADEALVISTVLPGRWSYTLLRYGRGANGSIHFAKRMTPDEVDGSFDAALPFSMAEALEQPTFTDADEAKQLVRQLIELGASVGLMPSYA
jgi:hypothetical protein